VFVYLKFGTRFLHVERHYTNEFLDVIAHSEEAGIDAGEQVAWWQLCPPRAPPIGSSDRKGARVDRSQ